MNPILDFEGVRRLLPQDHPFLFVDRVLEFEAERRIVSLKNVTGSEPFFAGHFPGAPIMPGALIGEAIAQTAILLFRLSRDERGNGSPEPRPKQIFVVGTTRTRFLHPVYPGDALRITVVAEKLLSSSGMVKGWGEVDGRKVVQSTLTLSAIPAEALESRRRPSLSPGADPEPTG